MENEQNIQNDKFTELSAKIDTLTGEIKSLALALAKIAENKINLSQAKSEDKAKELELSASKKDAKSLSTQKFSNENSSRHSRGALEMTQILANMN